MIFLINSITSVLTYWLWRKRWPDLFDHPFVAAKILSKDFWLSPTCRADYKWGSLNVLIKLSLKPAIVYLSWLNVQMIATKTPLIQFTNKLSENLALISVLIFILLLDDFSRFLRHYLMHKIPMLWRWHSLHHSAEALTPLTFYRVHPGEELISAIRKIATDTVSFALLSTVTDVYILEAYVGVSLSQVIASSLGHHLRHTSIPISYGRLESILTSPRAHQLHHSIELQHRDKNFGSVFSIWDQLFGTFLSAEPWRHKKLEYGIGQLN